MPDHINPGESVDWCSPPKVLDPVHEFFGGIIDLDPCSNDKSIVGATVEFKLPEHDGLKESWAVKGAHTSVYDNPPFGRCYVRDDGQVVLSAKQWTRGRKLFKDYQKLLATATQSDITAANVNALEMISDVEAARFRATSIRNWVDKAIYHHREDQTQVLTLIPAAVDTATWQDGVFPTADAVCYIKGRLTFLGNVKGPAPMACAIVGWVDDTDRFVKVFSKLGTCHRLRSL